LKDEKINHMWSFIFGSRKKRRRDDMIKTLRATPLFEGLSRRELKVMREIVHLRTYQEGEFVFSKGQPGAAMFIITEGQVEIVDYDDAGNRTVLATLGKGTFFGELALLDDSPRSASAVAAKPVKIYSFYRGDFVKLLDSAPRIGTGVYRALAMIIGVRLKVANENFINR